MHIFKNWRRFAVSVALAAVMACAPAHVFAEEARAFSAKGSIAMPDSITLLAPMGGQVEDFAWVPGDTVSAGELAFALKPTQVYAANDGVITGLRAVAGDQAQDIEAQYGALCYIKREGIWHVNASTATAYDNPDNRDVSIGDVLRVQTGSDSNKIKGEATVISVDGKDFVLEMEQGDFDLEDSIKVYLGTSKDHANKDLMGKGKVVRPAMLRVLGSGVVASVLVSEGERVTRGQPLFILDSIGARYGEEQVLPEVRFSEDALIGEILVQPGQFVQQGQAVMRLLPSGALEATLEVDELDIARVRVGQTVRVKVDAYQEERTGTVREIRPIGVTVLDTTKFDVRVTFEKTDDLMIGMHVTGYWD